MEENSLKRKKRMLIELVVVVILLFSLILRVGYIQLIDGGRLKNMALKQQSLERNVGAKRGTIYDATGENILAVSSFAESVTVNPKNIKSENKEKVAKALSEILNLEYDETLKKVNKNTSVEIIKKRIEKDEADKLRSFLLENKITSGVNIDEDSRRYYPYSSLAAQVIGFCGSDNQGLSGIEAKYDDILKGKNGSINKLVDGKGHNLNNEKEEYVESISGKDIVLTIDVTVQSIIEKHLEEACIDNKCTDGGNIIVMSPKTGDILGMAGYPSFDLNKPFEINNEELKNKWENISQEEKNKLLNEMWRNKAISDTYEPGSTFKLVTASAALEEKITDTDNKGEFNCSGGIEIAGVRIRCWRYYRPHGSESLREALMNSCNPVFIGLGQKIGVSKYYTYLNKFGLLNTTGIDLPGEAGSIFLKENKVGPVELATISFGQRFEVTPIQMITMVSTIANKGNYIAPRLVKEIINQETGEKEKIEIKKGKRVISEETSEKVLDMMNSVVSEGTGKNAKVEGYEIGGKTGTSEDGVNTNKYVTSFIGVANTNDPEVAILITLYNPTGEGGHQGGGVAAPIAGKIFSEILPYLEVKNTNDKIEEIQMPNITGKTISDAKKILEKLDIKIKGDNFSGDEIIKKQIPEEGIKVEKGKEIVVEVEQ